MDPTKATPLTPAAESVPEIPNSAEGSEFTIDTEYFRDRSSGRADEIVSDDLEHTSYTADSIASLAKEAVEELEEEDEKEQDEVELGFDLDDIEKVVRDANQDQTTDLLKDQAEVLEAIAERIEKSLTQKLADQSASLSADHDRVIDTVKSDFAAQLAVLKTDLLAEIKKFQGSGIPSENPPPKNSIADLIANASTLPEPSRNFDPNGHEQILKHLFGATELLSKGTTRATQAQRVELINRWNQAQLWVNKHIRSGTPDERLKNRILALKIQKAISDDVQLLNTRTT